VSLPLQLQGKLALPVVGSPMFIVSNPELVIAQCTSGIVGSFPALNARPKEELEGWILRIKAALADYQAAHPGERVRLRSEYASAKLALSAPG
jgi:nitronate monooxygenase